MARNYLLATPSNVLMAAEARRIVQIRDLNSGTFGFVELALDKVTGQQVAIKFIERGDKVTKYVSRWVSCRDLPEAHQQRLTDVHQPNSKSC